MSKIILLILLWNTSLFAAIISRDELAIAVVFLRQAKVQTVDVAGAKAEVWLKLPSDAAPQPKIEYDTGTGFFVTSGKRIYLVTASHVARSMTLTAEVTMSQEKDTPFTVPLGTLAGRQDANWFTHPEADVALLELTPTQDFIEKHLQKRFIDFSFFTVELNAPSRDIPLTVMGFPLAFGVEKFFSPLTQQTHGASGLLTLARADTSQKATFFLLESPSVGGYSGAPCFDISIYKLGAATATGSGTLCYGLMHGTISDATGGKLAAVTPAFFIVDTVKKYESSH